MVIEQDIAKYIKLLPFPELQQVDSVRFEFIGNTNRILCAIPCEGEKGTKIQLNRVGYRVRTPSILSDYNGKKIIVYRDFIDNSTNDIFRIMPVGFSFFRGKHVIPHRFPRFSRNGSLIIPLLYISDYLDEYAYMLKISFNMILNGVIDNNELIANVEINTDKRFLSYPLNIYSGGLRTRKLSYLMRYLNKNGKDINNFIYKDTYEKKGCRYGIMVFREVINE